MNSFWGGHEFHSIYLVANIIYSAIFLIIQISLSFKHLNVDELIITIFSVYLERLIAYFFTNEK